MRKQAGVSRRLAAYLLDIVPIILGVFAVFYLFLGFDQTLDAYFADSRDTDARGRFLVERNRIRDLAFLGWLVYSTLMEASAMQGTLGKRVMGIRVVGEDGGRITLRRSIRRNLAKLSSYMSLGLGFLWAAVSKRNRTWHDMLSSTDVVRGQPETGAALASDAKRPRRPDVSALPILGLGVYRKNLERIPQPTAEQIVNFALYASEAKSWYKHIALLPPGAPFTFFIDPWAGLDRILDQSGRVVHVHRTDQSPKFHHTWMTTEAYRSRFGRLAFACSAGTSLFMSVSVQLQDDRKITGVFDNNPCRASIHLGEDAEYQLPREVMHAGTTSITGMVHKLASRSALWSGLLRNDDDLLQWPAQSGGPDIGRKIAALVRAGQSSNASLNEVDPALEELLAPERRRLQQEMVLAINRVVALTYGKSG